MPRFSSTSKRRIATCHEDLQSVLRTVIRTFDFSVLSGHRGEDEQNALYTQGRTEPGSIVTNVQWPDSKHNTSPSIAVDIAPYPIDWDDLTRFHELAGRMLQTADLFDVTLEWGGHWSRFKDYPHYQLINPSE